MWWILFSIIITIVIIYKFIIHPYKYWVKRNVKQGNPIFPFGDNWGTVFKKQAFAELVIAVYNKYPRTRYCGLYQFSIPTLMIRDPDLIKQITVKDFDHFVDHFNVIPEEADPLWRKNLFVLKGQKWRAMRYTLSPAFTSSKMKYMFLLIAQSGEQFVNHFLMKKENLIVVDMKDVLTRFTNDVIASTAFGVECDSLKEKNNEFYTMGKNATDFSGFWKNVKLILYILMPWLFSVFKVPLFSKDIRNFFTRLVKSNIESREKQGIVRPDMITLMMEAKKVGLRYEETSSVQDTGFATVQESDIGKNHKRQEITDEDIVSQALLFLLAGFDSVSSVMCFMSYELGVNPEIQERLRQEVDATLEACDGKLTYEALFSMKYMDMVVCESLRKWPVAASVDRICTKPYTIHPVNPEEKPVHVEKDTVLWLPILGLHRDPGYFPDPDRFDPERFSDENKSNIKPYTYIPFGSGPRNCIGSRFALLETKILFFSLLTHFEIVPVEKTQIPLKLSKSGFNLAAEKGFWLGLKPRKNC